MQDNGELISIGKRPMNTERGGHRGAVPEPSPSQEIRNNEDGKGDTYHKGGQRVVRQNTTLGPG